MARESERQPAIAWSQIRPRQEEDKNPIRQEQFSSPRGFSPFERIGKVAGRAGDNGEFKNRVAWSKDRYGNWKDREGRLNFELRFGARI